MDDNLKLWNEVCTTDPAVTKHVNQRGGFTAICAQSQLKRATEMFGPYGDTWSLSELDWSFSPDNSSLWLEALFVYPDGSFPISGDMPWKVGNDCFKKLQTDVTTKALSKLGFNSDVFEGKFDDNKYVNERKEAARDNGSEQHRAPTAAPLDHALTNSQKTAAVATVKSFRGEHGTDFTDVEYLKRVCCAVCKKPKPETINDVAAITAALLNGEYTKDTGERISLGPYGELYLARKAYEAEHHPDLTPKHRDMRARRYMVKRVLRDMWRAWRAE